ncbi:unnamed protein product [Chrysoparadoxa australica]
MFGQLYRELHFLDPAALRMDYVHPMDDGQQRTFKVKFEGEGVDDYGGPYREVFTQVAEELIQIDSAAEESGQALQCILPVLAPTSSSGEVFTVQTAEPQPDVYNFFGQLLGICLRCKVATHWPLSKLLWKALTGEKFLESDLGQGDTSLGNFVREATELTTLGGLELVAAIEGLTWSAQGSNGVTTDLVPGGSRRSVKSDELQSFAHALVEYRLQEGDKAMFAVRDGLASVVPAPILPLLTWRELELLVCGTAGVDIDLLQQNTEYDDYISPSDKHIQSFWRVLRSFGDKDRAQFLRFVWARSRLPSHSSEFRQKFKIQAITGDGLRESSEAALLPRAHTCFFSLNLPRYPNDAITEERLRYAMYNCVEMDADFRLSEHESANWEALGDR